LIDDEEPVNFYNTKIIKDAGIAKEIVAIQSPEKALDFIRENNDIDMIFLDLNMPRMNGWEFLAEYLNLDREMVLRIIVVILSTSQNPDDIDRANEMFIIKDYINKPLDVGIVTELVDKYFKNKNKL
jgi:CheY-like chemotaxis protein